MMKNRETTMKNYEKKEKTLKNMLDRIPACTWAR
jgi:hypothetical protein